MPSFKRKEHMRPLSWELVKKCILMHLCWRWRSEWCYISEPSKSHQKNILSDSCSSPLFPSSKKLPLQCYSCVFVGCLGDPFWIGWKSTSIDQLRDWCELRLGHTPFRDESRLDSILRTFCRAWLTHQCCWWNEGFDKTLQTNNLEILKREQSLPAWDCLK